MRNKTLLVLFTLAMFLGSTGTSYAAEKQAVNPPKTMNVRLPDGRLITDVPEGTTKAQIAERFGIQLDAEPKPKDDKYEAQNEYYGKVLEKIHDNCDQFGGECHAKYSPERCKSLVWNFRETKLAWAMCVQSCGSTNIYSRTLGECSD